jgi:predicted ATPase/DNA-binding SARP family transcriptional activator
MHPFTISLLGSPRIMSSAGTRDLPPDQSVWLLCYVCVQDGWVSRESLKSLFWPDANESDASNNLRVLLHRTKRGLAGLLEVEPSRVRVTVSSDVKAFRAALQSEDWQDAIEFFQGDLLEGAQPNSGDFDAWLEQEREHLRSGWQSACLNRARILEADRPEVALALLEGVCRWDDLCEEALQGVLRLSAILGQRERGVRRFETFEAQLWRELGLRPQNQTLELLEVLRATQGQASEGKPVQAKPVQVEIVPEANAGFRHALPAALTGFVGREDELHLIGEQLGDAGVRLLTLTGPGGTGKTRLSLEVASQIQSRFEHGACLVACVSVTQVSQLPNAICDALGLLGSSDPNERLCEYLRDRELLLILDNLEQLGDQDLDEIAGLLEAAPRVRCLLTSREPLRLPGEAVFDLWGLPYPTLEQFDDGLDAGTFNLEAIAEFDAVRLFTQAARRAQARFGLNAETAPGVARITQLVAGMPLGLELAAAWTPVLSPVEIAQELSRSLDAISSSNPSLPERHRSFRAVFEHSWNRLSTQEQNAFEQLGVFRGGFSRDAALNIAGASANVLLSLVQKSLLRRNASGRFELHELIRQFLEEKLFEAVPVAQSDLATNADVTPDGASSRTNA